MSKSMVLMLISAVLAITAWAMFLIALYIEER